VVPLLAGLLVEAFVLWVFAWRGGYADPEEFPGSVERAHLRRVAGARVVGLCPGAVRRCAYRGASGRREITSASNDGYTSSLETTNSSTSAVALALVSSSVASNFAGSESGPR